MNLALVITHNKPDNAAQIEALKPLITKQTEKHDVIGEDGKPTGETYETYYYTLQGMPDHKVKFYQIIPFGVTPPANLDQIDSHKVFYGKGDEDKTGNHPRFFNWGLKRATDYGADYVIHLEDYSKFIPASVNARLLVNQKRQQTTYGRISRKDDLQIRE